jgi:NAD(P)-dependent dehydrogenase (short-subunit alcohol dehydrogenase family)
MRTPSEDVLPRSERLRVLALDVTQPDNIAAALEESGPIDVLVNNAGIGLLGAFEATPMAMAREVFETNTFGCDGHDAGGAAPVPRSQVGRGW